MHRQRTLLAVILIAAQVLFVSCQKNPVESSDEAPALPPAESMRIDLSFFKQPAPAGKALSPEAGSRNFANAALRVLIINAVVVAVMALPAGTLAAAVSQDPMPQDDGKFHWIYTYEDSTVRLQADLAGWIDRAKQESVWEMYVSNSLSNPPLDHYLWYEGRVKLDRKSGFWDIYDAARPDTAIGVLHIDWEMMAKDSAKLVFTVVKPDVPEKGDSVTYLSEGNTRSITWFDASAGATVEIGWDAATGAGYLIAPDYNNGEKACWDEQRQDVSCSQ